MFPLVSDNSQALFLYSVHDIAGIIFCIENFSLPLRIYLILS